MRHDVISTKLHSLDCRCDRCAQGTPQRLNRWVEAMEPGDVDMLKKAVSVALWANGLMAAAHYAPTVIDWIAS